MGEAISRDEAEDFLYEEARLLDERLYDDWLTLFTDDGVYWLPIDDKAAPDKHLSLVYDNHLRIEERVYRLTQYSPPAQTPPSRTQHFVSNVQAWPGENGADAVLHSAQMIYEMRAGDYRQFELGDPRSFAARCEHHLRSEGGVWKIALKRMVLLNRDVPIPNLTFII
ncbi:MAG: aromatic-ring-hydroxylating dioxygenase subunit beta [Proteobacteria bacterium]|nr:aromatic-ring-hydroxylating dioxygenase subunit beta [Pseudomonadota bacterium]